MWLKTYINKFKKKKFIKNEKITIVTFWQFFFKIFYKLFLKIHN